MAAVTAFPPIPKKIQTTLVLDEALWRQAKVRAVDERTKLRVILTKALETYLATPLPQRAG
jgi:hypothetical protein